MTDSGSRPPLSPELRALLERERVLPAVPPSVRTRAIARARAALVAGRVTVSSSFGPVLRHRWGMTVALACAASVAVGATAYEIGAHRRAAASNAPAASVAQVAPPPPSAASAAPVIAVPPAQETPAIAAMPSSSSTPVNKARSAQVDPGPDELRLLRQARTAVARGDFAAALPPIAEHAHRFKNGRLAEEREALRVRALSGLGRTEDAQRAADAFEARFPRSVLLPAVSKMPASGP